MSQHFLLSKAARSLSVASVMRLSGEDAFKTLREIRWSSTDGDPWCPDCGSIDIYEFPKEDRYRCRDCRKKFSVTSGTIFASRKMPIRDILGAIAIFVNGAKGVSALQLSRDLGVQYKTAFVLAHKLREAMDEEVEETLKGQVEVDGAYFGGHVKPANKKADRVDRRKTENKTGKKQVVVVARERHGRAVAWAQEAAGEGEGTEGAAVPRIVEIVEPDAVVHADEGTGWGTLERWFETKRINHKKAYSLDGACTNWAESFFSRMRRAEIGVHHRISGPYLDSYAAEMAWRENYRRTSNGELFVRATRSALHHPVSRQWKGYWQRRAVKDAA